MLFTTKLEAKLARSATLLGRNPGELVRQVVERYFDEESRFVDAVNRGENALLHGEYLTHEQVGQRLERFLRPRWRSAGAQLSTAPDRDSPSVSRSAGSDKGESLGLRIETWGAQPC